METSAGAAIMEFSSEVSCKKQSGTEIYTGILLQNCVFARATGAVCLWAWFTYNPRPLYGRALHAHRATSCKLASVHEVTLRFYLLSYCSVHSPVLLSVRSTLVGKLQISQVRTFAELFPICDEVIEPPNVHLLSRLPPVH